jgi:hypothetical protein
MIMKLPEMTASTDYVPLLLNYFPLFVMIGDDLTCNGVKLLFSFFCPSTGRHLHELPGYLTQPIADTFNSVSAPSVCRAVGDVCRGLCQIARQFMKMPTGARAEENLC